MSRKLYLEDFRPVPMLKVKATPLVKARFPAVDFHNHLGSGRGSIYISPSWKEPASRVVREMDAAGVKMVVNLDGGWRAPVEMSINRYDRAHKGRFATFKALDLRLLKRPDFGKLAAADLEDAVRKGARGLKVTKQLGLAARDASGRLVPPDDRRLAPLWDKAAELGVPVLIHAADPQAFFLPLTRANERWEEMSAHPDWCFNTPGFPPYAEVMAAMRRLFSRHRRTSFVAAHVMSCSEDLDFVMRVLDRCPNVSVDIAMRISELGRQPYTARKFFLDYADRILFATDIAPCAETYRLYFRFLETYDEYFPYVNLPVPPQGRWRIYGLGLPDGVLKKVYCGNAKRLLKIK